MPPSVAVRRPACRSTVEGAGDIGGLIAGHRLGVELDHLKAHWASFGSVAQVTRLTSVVGGHSALPAPGFRPQGLRVSRGLSRSGVLVLLR
jgi:hypothetical protein